MRETITLDEFYARSDAFIDSLDRGVLGRFAVDREALSIHNRINYNQFLVSYGTIIEGNSGELYTATGMQLLERLKFASGATGKSIPVLRKDVYYELMYWWSQSDNKSMRHEADDEPKVADMHVTRKRMNQLAMVAICPNYHDYFAVGIWDLGYIERCYNDGIDPVIALELRVVH